MKEITKSMTDDKYWDSLKSKQNYKVDLFCHLNSRFSALARPFPVDDDENDENDFAGDLYLTSVEGFSIFLLILNSSRILLQSSSQFC